MKTVEEIKQILITRKQELREKFKVKELMIFGSTIRGENKRKSDIDILVDFEEGADLFDLVGLSLFLERKLQRKVDIVPKRVLRKEIRESVLKEAVAL
jgi:predicted nucleotidyltransferase